MVLVQIPAVSGQPAAPSLLPAASVPPASSQAPGQAGKRAASGKGWGDTSGSQQGAAGDVLWQVHEKDKLWRDVDDGASQRLEDARRQGPQTVELIHTWGWKIQNGKSTTYTLDLSSMMRSSGDGASIRRVRRLLIT